MRILLGGSPCTYWSIAQKNNRETEASGMGWELFKNYLIAKEKFKPDYFLYENNVSAAPSIKSTIQQELGVRDIFNPSSDVEYIEINSALVSAQNRERFYVHNCGYIQEPKDSGILLRDVMERGHRVPEYTNSDKSRPLNASYSHKGCGCGSLLSDCFPDKPNKQVFDYVVAPIRVGGMPRPNGEPSNSQGLRIYSIDGKAVAQSALGGGLGAKTDLYAVPLEEYNYATEFGSNGKPTKAYCYVDGKIHTVYEVKDGKITIKGKEYPIELADGFYIIRKLTVNECRRLQTIPDWYKMPCSDTQNYKMLGNGWTIEVIKHILSHIHGITSGEPIEVLSMYDGMSCGQIALKELGANVVKYHATEIDKYAIQTTQTNFPDTIQWGDAFQVRNENWRI